MILDKEEHRTILLELIDRAHFPGAVRKMVNEIADAVENATVDAPVE